MKYKVWIYDSESGCNQPMRCEAKNEAEARRKGNEYIRNWNLMNGVITMVEPQGGGGIMTEAVEMCPFCGLENVLPNYDVKKSGFVVSCQHCGEEMMLCDECYHCGDNDSRRCDWHEDKFDGGTEGHCFRGVTSHPRRMSETRK